MNNRRRKCKYQFWIR